MINMASFRYYTDGAATMIRKNGKYLREAGGWAFVLLIDNREDSVCSGGCPLTTNNEMELYAIYASMKDFLLKSESGDMVEICSDSSYCIDIFTTCMLKFKKVKGHSSNQWNNKADELAGTAKNIAFKSGKTVYYGENDGLLGEKSNYVD